jgi:hypothetical protein
MLNLAMDLDNYLEQLSTYISLVVGFHVNQPEEKREDRVDEKVKITLLLMIILSYFSRE